MDAFPPVEEILEGHPDYCGPIRNLLQVGRSRLLKIDEQLEELTTEIARLHEEQRLLSNRVAQYATALSPVSRMPVEILSAIFLLSILPELQAPWRLRRVCKRWREIALGYSALWTRFTNAWSDNIEEQLHLSGTRPIDISLEFSEEGQEVMRHFVPHSHRWRSLRIQCNDRYVLEYLAREDGGALDFAQLQHVELFTYHERRRERESPPKIPLEAFRSAPKLRSVFLTDPSLIGTSTEFVLPWPQITHYRASFIASTHLTYLAAMGKNLIECELGRSWDLDTGAPQDVSLPLLQKLTLQDSNILPFIVAPALRFLHTNKGPVRTLEFIVTSGCALDTLVLGHYPNESAIPLLAALPTLSSLVVFAETFGEDLYDDESESLAERSSLDFLREIVARQWPMAGGSDVPLLPALSFLALGSSDNSSPIDDALITVVQTHPLRLRLFSASQDQAGYDFYTPFMRDTKLDFKFIGMSSMDKLMRTATDIDWLRAVLREAGAEAQALRPF